MLDTSILIGKLIIFFQPFLNFQKSRCKYVCHISFSGIPFSKSVFSFRIIWALSFLSMYVLIQTLVLAYIIHNLVFFLTFIVIANESFTKKKTLSSLHFKRKWTKSNLQNNICDQIIFPVIILIFLVLLLCTLKPSSTFYSLFHIYRNEEFCSLLNLFTNFFCDYSFHIMITWSWVLHYEWRLIDFITWFVSGQFVILHISGRDTWSQAAYNLTNYG